MCGIIGFIGKIYAINFLYNGIVSLQNRGYDSIGICTLKTTKTTPNKKNNIENKNEFINTKYANTEKNASELISASLYLHENNEIGIAHCRWATHGAKNNINAHPHIDYKNKFCIVHNGIIDNYNVIKNDLINNYGVTFLSQTDSEVIVNLISVLFEKTKNIKKAIQMAINKMTGTWAFLLLYKNEKKIYCCCHGCPLVIGIGKEYIMMSSEIHGFCDVIDKYFFVDDDKIIIIDDNRIYGNKKCKIHDFLHVKEDNDENNYIIDDLCEKKYKENNDKSQLLINTPFPYKYWTVKEICDQPQIIKNIINKYISNNEITFTCFKDYIDKIHSYNNIIMLGCGSSYNACMYCSYIFKDINNISTTQVFDGATFKINDISKKGKTLIILVSQSGETKDLQRCLEIIKNKKKIITIGLINVPGSWIARNVDICINMCAGREVAVASTKSYTTQVILLSLLAIWYNKKNKINIYDDLYLFGNNIYYILNDSLIKNKCYEIALYLAKCEHVFILGKNNCEHIAKESALKIKELGYIHAEGYNSSALKHGTYSLLINKFPVIIIIPNDNDFNKNSSIVEEIKSRNAFVIGISNVNLSDIFDISVIIPSNGLFSDLLCIIPLQLIAYYMAIIKKHNPDMPRNLAKIVSVD